MDDCFGTEAATGLLNDRLKKQLRADAPQVMIVFFAVSDDVQVAGHVMLALAAVPPIGIAHVTAPHVIGQAADTAASHNTHNS